MCHVVTGCLYDVLCSDFDVHLYLCNAAFSYLDFEIFVRLSRRLVFPIYAVAHGGLLMLLMLQVLRSWRQ